MHKTVSNNYENQHKKSVSTTYLCKFVESEQRRMPKPFGTSEVDDTDFDGSQRYASCKKRNLNCICEKRAKPKRWTLATKAGDRPFQKRPRYKHTTNHNLILFNGFRKTHHHISQAFKGFHKQNNSLKQLIRQL